MPFSGILHIAQSIPHKTTDIELVVKDARTALGIAIDRGGAPDLSPEGPVMPSLFNSKAMCLGDLPAAKSWKTLTITLACSGLIDLRPGRMVLRLHYIVAVGDPTARSADLDASSEASPGLLGQIPEKQRIHRSLESDMEVGDLALTQSNYGDLGKPHALVESSGVLLISANAVQGLRLKTTSNLPRPASSISA